MKPWVWWSLLAGIPVALVGLFILFNLFEGDDDENQPYWTRPAYVKISEKIDKIEKGMSKKQVLELLGQPTHPDRINIFPNKEDLTQSELYPGPLDNAKLAQLYPNGLFEVRSKWVFPGILELYVTYGLDDIVDRTFVGPLPPLKDK